MLPVLVMALIALGLPAMHCPEGCTCLAGEGIQPDWPVACRRGGAPDMLLATPASGPATRTPVPLPAGNMFLRRRLSEEPPATKPGHLTA